MNAAIIRTQNEQKNIHPGTLFTVWNGRNQLAMTSPAKVIFLESIETGVSVGRRLPVSIPVTSLLRSSHKASGNSEIAEKKAAKVVRLHNVCFLLRKTETTKSRNKTPPM